MIPLPPILERRPVADGLTLRLKLDAEHRAFAGHFPDHPVLPGVVQLAWVQMLARDAFALQTPVMHLEQIKFRALITPGGEVQLRLRLDAERGKVSFEYRQEDKIVSSGRLGPGDEK